MTGDDGPQVLSVSDYRNRWFMILVTEDRQPNVEDMETEFRLVAPNSAVDYNLMVICSDCDGTEVYTSENPAGVDDVLYFSTNDGVGANNRTYYVYVESNSWSQMLSCDYYTLQITGDVAIPGGATVHGC